jgi:hypothetical protein
MSASDQITSHHIHPQLLNYSIPLSQNYLAVPLSWPSSISIVLLATISTCIDRWPSDTSRAQRIRPEFTFTPLLISLLGQSTIRDPLFWRPSSPTTQRPEYSRVITSRTAAFHLLHKSNLIPPFPTFLPRPHTRIKQLAQWIRIGRTRWTWA